MPFGKRSKNVSCNTVSNEDLKNVEGLVNSKRYTRRFTKQREATPEERASIADLSEKSGRPLPPGKKVIYSEPGEEPAKIIRLATTGFPMIDDEWVIWPNDDINRICEEVSSFYMLGDGMYYTNKVISATSSPSKEATGKWRGSGFPSISNEASIALHDGRTTMHTIDHFGVEAISNLKRLLGTD